MSSGNFFQSLPHAAPDELIETLAQSGGARVERIVSTGQKSPPGFWYDQAWAEWVMVLSGHAELFFEGEAAPRSLGPGDYVLIPAKKRHRVESTTADEPTVWLAMHFPPA
jgi:cupin 2 domain-containing protein